MTKYALISILALVGMFGMGCTAELPECEDTEAEPGAEPSEDPPCDDEGVPEKKPVSLSNDEGPVYCGKYVCE